MNKGFWTRRKAIFATAVGAVLLVPGLAWAAAALFGFGTLDANATTHGLTVNQDSVQLTSALAPGGSAGAKAIVNNPNDFPVTVTNVILQSSSFAVTGDGCATSVHPASGTTVPYPGTGGGDGIQLPVTENVVVPAGQSKWVEVASVVKQDAEATGFCGVHAAFAVKGQTGS